MGTHRNFTNEPCLDLQTDPQLTFVSGEDWVGLYVDGKLIDEGHCFDAEEIVQLFTKNVRYVDLSSRVWLSKGSYLPLTLADLEAKNLEEDGQPPCACCHVKYGKKHHTACWEHKPCNGKGCERCQNGRYLV